MVKLKAPLVSLKAIGRLGNITFLRRRHTNIAEKTPVVPDQKTLAQLSWRHMYQKAVALWHALSAGEKEEWESQARRRHMTGFAWFMSQALKPNPGLYLPLQGGTMTGDITMGKNRLLKLPLPTDSQEPLTLAYYTANIAPYFYKEGARVRHTVTQSIPDTTLTVLAFNSERYDTDGIHDPVTNNSRLTCKTAGTYLIGFTLLFDASAVGERRAQITLNGTLLLLYPNFPPRADYYCAIMGNTVYKLAVNDYVEVSVWQNSGNALDVKSTNAYTPEFYMQRIGA